MFIFDSSVVIEILNGTLIGKRISEQLNGAKFGVTAFSVYEIKKGERSNEAQIIDHFFESVPIFEFNKNAAKRSAQLEKELSEKRSLINKVDIFIAAICLSNDFELLTLDSDFKKVPGLKLREFI